MGMFKINWKLRLSNEQYLFQVLLAVTTPIMAYKGITASDIDTWVKLFSLVVESIKNPFIVFSIIVGIYNATIDNTTPGIGDSERALSYRNVHKNASKSEHETAELE